MRVEGTATIAMTEVTEIRKKNLHILIRNTKFFNY